MSNKLTEQIKKSGEEFEKEYPINYGNPFPHFIETPVATHILHFLTSTQIKLLKVLKEEVEKVKVSHASDCPYMHWGCECDFALKEGTGYNIALSQVIYLLDKTIKENE